MTVLAVYTYMQVYQGNGFYCQLDLQQCLDLFVTISTSNSGMDLPINVHIAMVHLSKALSGSLSHINAYIMYTYMDIYLSKNLPPRSIQQRLFHTRLFIQVAWDVFLVFIDTGGNAAATVGKKFGKNNFRRQNFGQIYTRIYNVHVHCNNTIVNQIQRTCMIQFNARNQHLRILILYGVIDNLYQKTVHFSKLKLRVLLDYRVYANRTQAKKKITILNFVRFSGRGRHALH